jgi:4-carboxymuconolactone decarboxylase
VGNYREILRRLTVRDDRFVEILLGDERENIEASALDPKTYALVRLGALIALDATPASYEWCVERALAAGATADEIVGSLLAVLPATGVPRVTSAAPKLGLALGYDVEEALEAFTSHDEPRP